MGPHPQRRLPLVLDRAELVALMANTKDIYTVVFDIHKEVVPDLSVAARSDADLKAQVADHVSQALGAPVTVVLDLPKFTKNPIARDPGSATLTLKGKAGPGTATVEWVRRRLNDDQP